MKRKLEEKNNRSEGRGRRIKWEFPAVHKENAAGKVTTQGLGEQNEESSKKRGKRLSKRKGRQA